MSNIVNDKRLAKTNTHFVAEVVDIMRFEATDQMSMAVIM